MQTARARMRRRACPRDVERAPHRTDAATTKRITGGLSSRLDLHERCWSASRDSRRATEPDARRAAVRGMEHAALRTAADRRTSAATRQRRIVRQRPRLAPLLVTAGLPERITWTSAGDPCVALTLGDATRQAEAAPIWCNQLEWTEGARSEKIVQGVSDQTVRPRGIEAAATDGAGARAARRAVHGR